MINKIHRCRRRRALFPCPPSPASSCFLASLSRRDPPRGRPRFSFHVPGISSPPPPPRVPPKLHANLEPHCLAILGELLSRCISSVFAARAPGSAPRRARLVIRLCSSVEADVSCRCSQLLGGTNNIDFLGRDRVLLCRMPAFTSGTRLIGLCGFYSSRRVILSIFDNISL